MRVIDIVGQRYGRLEVVRFSHTDGKKRRYVCKCDCGNESVCAAGDLRYGRSTSCGCRRFENTRKRIGFNDDVYSPQREVQGNAVHG